MKDRAGRGDELKGCAVTVNFNPHPPPPTLFFFCTQKHHAGAAIESKLDTFGIKVIPRTVTREINTEVKAVCPGRAGQKILEIYNILENIILYC